MSDEMENVGDNSTPIDMGTNATGVPFEYSPVQTLAETDEVLGKNENCLSVS